MCRGPCRWKQLQKVDSIDLLKPAFVDIATVATPDMPPQHSHAIIDETISASPSMHPSRILKLKSNLHCSVQGHHLGICFCVNPKTLTIKQGTLSG